MATSQAERVRRELKKELTDWDLIAQILHLVQRGEQSKLVDFLYARLIDVIVEQTVTEGHFSIHRVLTIKAREQEEDGSLRIDAKASDTIKLLRKAHLAGVVVDRDNWQEVIKAVRQEMKRGAVKKSHLYNPMLDEEGEDE